MKEAESVRSIERLTDLARQILYLDFAQRPTERAKELRERFSLQLDRLSNKTSATFLVDNNQGVRLRHGGVPEARETLSVRFPRFQFLGVQRGSPSRPNDQSQEQRTTVFQRSHGIVFLQTVTVEESLDAKPR